VKQLLSRSDKFLFRGPCITRSRVIPGLLSRIRERSSLVPPSNSGMAASLEEAKPSISL
jgi:hypothetical protein